MNIHWSYDIHVQEPYSDSQTGANSVDPDQTTHNAESTQFVIHLAVFLIHQ